MSPAASAKILVVDDNPGTLYATSRVLRAAGFGVIEAGTGRAGLAASEQADLVVLDINLPDIDGYEVCREIRANPATARLPVVHLSATFINERDKVRGLDFGADGYLTHPVEAPVLVATINAFLRARQAEEAMRESEAKFRAIFDQTPHGIALVSQDFVYLEVNEAMCRILGRTREQIVGKHNSAFTVIGRESDVVAVVAELEHNKVWQGCATTVRSDATHVELEWTISQFTVPGVRLAIVTDITARRAAEDQREQLLASERAARAEAERANRLKDDFLATLSHELRTPLNAIVGWCQILRRGTPTVEDLTEGLESIERNVHAQSQLIADLLDVSRITSGKLRLELQPVDPSAIIGAALDAVRAAAAAKGITIRRRLAMGGDIMADGGRLQQIIWNLVNNAVKFTPPDGAIDVHLDYLPGAIQVVVADHGQGIAPTFLPYIFERFSQADASSRRVHGGLGIGLAIVKNLVEMHGGTIRAESAGLGAGARFTVLLPLVSPAPAAAPTPAGLPIVAAVDAPASLAEISLHGTRVLVVDDDPDARRVLRRLLTDFDAIVADAASVRDGLQAIDTFRPQVVISDIGMPGEDGYDLIRQLRARNSGSSVLPAIALTAFAGKEDVRRALADGFQCHLAKPVNPNVLVAEIARIIATQGKAPQAAP